MRTSTEAYCLQPAGRRYGGTERWITPQGPAVSLPCVPDGHDLLCFRDCLPLGLGALCFCRGPRGGAFSFLRSGDWDPGWKATDGEVPLIGSRLFCLRAEPSLDLIKVAKMYQ